MPGQVKEDDVAELKNVGAGIREAAVAGVSAYIVKPFNIETLGKRLLEAYKKHNPGK